MRWLCAVGGATSRPSSRSLTSSPGSTGDPLVPSGDRRVVEQRSAEEVTQDAGHSVAPPDTAAVNPAFDITPAELILPSRPRKVFLPSATSGHRKEASSNRQAAHPGRRWRP
jgi:hypothetical protein